MSQTVFDVANLTIFSNTVGTQSSTVDPILILHAAAGSVVTEAVLSSDSPLKLSGSTLVHFDDLAVNDLSLSNNVLRTLAGADLHIHAGKSVQFMKPFKIQN